MRLTLLDGSISGQDSLDESTTQKHPLGTMARDNNGGIYRYFQNAGTATVAGSLYQGPAVIPNHLARTAPATALGSTSLSFTPGNTAGAANLYAEGWMQVDTTPGNGYMYSVLGHPAITASVAFTVTLAEPISGVALTTGSTIGLVSNPWKNCIVTPTTQTQKAAGFACAVISASTATVFYFGWLKTRGPVAALINGTPLVGGMVVASATAAGGVDIITTTNLVLNQIVGCTMQVGVSGKNNSVYALVD